MPPRSPRPPPRSSPNCAREAIAARGRFVCAVSGGKTPWIMLRDLATEDLDWNKIHIAQVDERIAPAGHADRNFTQFVESFISRVAIPAENILAMPVESTDLAQACRDYAKRLSEVAGEPPVLDPIHLGLGTDGHTASLVPGDPVLNVADVDVATTDVYQNRRRMTLTYPIIDRARTILWVATGRDKAEQLRSLRTADPTIPAGRVAQHNAVIYADQDAAF
ncbi:MAG: 6-phosphogluconolactonase [Pirellulales bacterium]